MLRTKNFSLETDKMLQCQCGHEKCDKPILDRNVLIRLQSIRDDLGMPMQITSGARCKYHPIEASKTKPGSHFHCIAVDIACDSKQMETKLKVLAGRHGATRVAGTHEDGFIHMDWSDTTRKDVPTWSYIKKRN